jgi:hypothetical protein
MYFNLIPKGFNNFCLPWILNQNWIWIWESCNNKNCLYFQTLSPNIFIQIFCAWEGPFWIKSNLNFQKLFKPPVPTCQPLPSLHSARWPTRQFPVPLSSGSYLSVALSSVPRCPQHVTALEKYKLSFVRILVSRSIQWTWPSYYFHNIALYKIPRSLWLHKLFARICTC